MLRYFSLIIFLLVPASFTGGENCNSESSERVVIIKDGLKDKIKGGWAGQVIGCSYGGPTEFRYKGKMIGDDVKIPWNDDYLKTTFISSPGLYDDVYMDLTFIEVMKRSGIDAPADSFAVAFANDDYSLWHANQNARYNILNGIMPPASGYWTNNPHADDIDFQIESDFAGMISPGMFNTAAEICDRTGHIMNYGDGWYGGVFTSALYTYAFINDDVDSIVEKAIETIPMQSRFYKCINDVIKWHKQFPGDWKSTWLEVQKNYTTEKGCPEGVFDDFDIDACVNAAYVAIGLLYGEKDFFKTIDIATRCGQDSDCNPATAGGILGVILGYSKIPAFWKPAVEKIADLDFPYTTMTLNQVYDITYNMAVSQIIKCGGSSDGNKLTIKVQEPVALKLEQSFEGIYPKERKAINKEILDEDINVSFEGSGIVIMGAVKRISGNDNSYVARLRVTLDGGNAETFNMPYDYIKRKYDIYYKYLIPEKTHDLRIEWLNKNKDFRIAVGDFIIYTNNKPAETTGSIL